ncbi:MAG: hypothetical protein K6G60_01685 [Lachnospiraceae bacterium]|nr:hypothetical protein [Lachnospiraceae bacterium]
MLKRSIAALPALSFITAVLMGTVTLFAFPKKNISEAERRPLASAPVLSCKNVMKGDYFEDLDLWTADHFAGRETLRHLRFLFQTGILNENEYNGFVNHNGYIISLPKNINSSSIAYAAERFNAVWERYLKNSGSHIYRTLVPDKSSFAGKWGYPTIDLDLMDQLYADSLPFAEAISLRDILSLEDYYYTDSHWRQEKLTPAAKHILEAMGRDSSLLDGDLETDSLYPFLGVYAGQSAMDPDPETIYWLKGGYLNELKAINLEIRAPLKIYDPEGCDPKDLYTLFLGGGLGLIRIENPDAPEGQLVIFRDSYASSMAPLLASAYRTVYLVDMRYAHPDVYGRFIPFENSDVLFMFSETLMNNSQGIR